MEVNKKTIIIISLLLILLGAGIGKYASPEKVVTKTETVTVEKEVIKYRETNTENTKVDKVTVITEDISKDGTIHRETVQIDKTQIDKYIDKHLDKTKDSKETTVTQTEKINQSLWHVSALASVKQGEIPSYGALVEKRVLGSISVGAFGLTNKTAGVTIGYSF
jgi:hypothetical protein